MIYFDNAATSLQKPTAVADAVYKAITTVGNSGRGSHDSSLLAGRMIYDTREALGRLFHIENPSRIAFTSNATESLNIAIKGILSEKDHVITTEAEHNSVLRPLYEMKEKGMELAILESDQTGNIPFHQIKERKKENTKMVICTHSSNVTGNLFNIKEIGQICKEEGLLFVVDAAQTAGVFPINVMEQNIDILCFTGHKGLLGPQGTGGIYVREGIDITPLKTGGSGFATFSKTHPNSMPECLEAGTVNGHGICGLHAGVSYILEYGIDKIRETEQKLMWQFYEGIKDIPNIKLYGDFTTKNRSPILSFTLSDYDSSILCDELANVYHIHTRGGGHCAPLLHQRMGTKEQGMVRFSFSHFNTEGEVDTAIKVIKEIAKEE